MRAIPLDVTGAFHSPSMAGAASPSARRSTRVELRPPAVTVFSGLTRAPFADVRAELAAALIRPVRWRETMLALAACGADSSSTSAPTQVLARLVARNLRAACSTRSRCGSRASGVERCRLSGPRSRPRRAGGASRLDPHGRASSASATALPERGSRAPRSARAIGVDAEWIERRTGIRERRYAAPGQRVSDLAARAPGGPRSPTRARRGASSTWCSSPRWPPTSITPAAAPIVAHELGAVNAAAIDVGAACTGSIAALAHATAWIEAGRARHVLVIGAEILTRLIDPDDRRTAPLFGDGAGAIVVSLDADGQIGPFVFGSDGARAEAIRATRERGVLEMDGHETFLQAVHRLSTCTAEVRRARRARARRRRPVRLPPGQRADPRAPWPNASSCRASACSTASPTSATRARRACRWRSAGGPRRARSQPGARVVLGAIGAGLTWGATVVTWGARVTAVTRARGLRARDGRLARHRRGDRPRAGGRRLAGRRQLQARRGRAAATVERIAGRRRRALAVRADVTAPEEVEPLFDTLEQAFGRVLVLVNNAGVRSDDLALSLTDDDWERVIDTNLSAAFRLTRRALRGMIRARFGRVVNIASVVGPRANAGPVQLRGREGRADRHDQDRRRRGGAARRDRQRDRPRADRDRHDERARRQLLSAFPRVAPEPPRRSRRARASSPPSRPPT